MNKMSTLISSAILSGLLAGTVAHAQDNSAAKKDEHVAAGKNACNGKEMGEKNSCKGQEAAADQMKKKKKKSEKNSCKNSCGAEKKQEAVTTEQSK